MGADKDQGQIKVRELSEQERLDQEREFKESREASRPIRLMASKVMEFRGLDGETIKMHFL